MSLFLLKAYVVYRSKNPYKFMKDDLTSCKLLTNFAEQHRSFTKCVDVVNLVDYLLNNSSKIVIPDGYG